METLIERLWHHTLADEVVKLLTSTGTLTFNQMTVREIWADGKLFTTSGTGYEPTGEIQAAGDDAIEVSSNVAAHQCLLTGLLCNDSQLVLDESRWKQHGDPTEGALIAVAGKAAIDAKRCGEQSPRLDTIPFESQHQYMATLHKTESDQARQMYVKGAVEIVLSKCS